MLANNNNKRITSGLIAMMCVLVVPAGCNSTPQEDDVVVYVDAYASFMDSVETAEKEFTLEEMEAIRNEYEIMRAGVENKRHLMSDEQIAEVERNNTRYFNFRRQYETRFGDETGPDKLERMLEGPEDEPQAITSGNLVETYHQFVREVKMNKEQYSSDDWTQIDTLWNRLNRRKTALKDSINIEAANEINKLKVEYGQYKVHDQSLQK
ncbi:MAG: hypothetical protein WD077_03100 [Bacteroidia bacterium]